MKVEDLPWYSPMMFLVGAILSFADPITDTLTLVEFYRADHDTWFYVGLVFVLLPCFIYPYIYLVSRDELEQYSVCRKVSQTVFCGFHPFSVAFARLEAFFYFLKKWCCSFLKKWCCSFLKKWCCGSEIGNELSDGLLKNIEYAALIEVIFESAPQFILQLYAMSVQEEPVKDIQIISLPISVLSLSWAFTNFDQLSLKENFNLNLSLKDKLALFVTHLILLSSRLFAVVWFSFSYKAWIAAAFLLHAFVFATAENIAYCLLADEAEGEFDTCHECTWNPFTCAAAGLMYWIRDDFLLLDESNFDLAIRKTAFLRMHLFCNVMFVLGNVVMILLFYFGQQSHTWYTFPATICVCSFSFLGSVMRVTLYRVFLKRESDDTVNTEQNDNSSQFDTAL